MGLQIGVVLAAVLIAIVPILLLWMRRRSKIAAAAIMQKTLAEDGATTFEAQLASRAASQERLDAEALQALKLPPAGTKKSEILSKHLKKAIKADPVVSAQLLRTWINENDT